MRASCILLALTAVLLASPALAGTVTLYDFETSADGWTTDWGLKQPPTNAVGRARQGDGSLFFDHEFKKNQESVGVRILYDEPVDYGEESGFAGFSVWVYFPRGLGWEAQIYYHSGDNWEWNFGPLYSNLQPGWNQIQITRKQMKTTSMRDLGVQIKNFKLKDSCEVYIDRVEALYTDGSQVATRR